MEILKQPPEGDGWIKVMTSVPLSYDRMDLFRNLYAWHCCDIAFVESDYSPIDEMIGFHNVDVLAKHRNGESLRLYEAIITNCPDTHWDERIVVPVVENGLGEEEADAEKWIADHLLYGWKVNVIRFERIMLPVSTMATLVECSETEVLIYDQASYQAEMWDRPFDDAPVTKYFINVHAYDCYYGHVYGKDFRYFECCKCDRVICEQNPSNGWMVQYRSWEDGYEQICLKCYEEHIMEHGIDVTQLKNDFPGMFLDDDEALERGWTKDRDYFVNYGNKAWVKEEIMKLYNAGNKILITYFSIGLGGGEGSISVFHKPREQEEEENETEC